MKITRSLCQSGALLTGILAFNACNPTSSTNSSVPAPSGLSYDEDTTVFATGVLELSDDIASVTGTVTRYSVSPPLPAGLTVDSGTGRLSGRPVAASPFAAYVITASNSGGSTTVTMYVSVMTLDTTLHGLVQHIFDQNCADDCHKPGGSGYLATGGANGGLDLTQGNAYASLINHHTYEDSAHAPFLRVKPGDPDSSYLCSKLVANMPKSGLRMPYDGPPYLTSDQDTIIKRWIALGAPQ